MPDSPTANVEETVDTVAPATSDVNTPADSSNADKGVEKKTLLETVQAVLKGPETSPGSENKDPNVDPKAAEPAKEEPLPDEISEQEMKQYGPKTQRRMRQLLDQRADLRSKFDTIRPKAEEYDKIIEVARKGQLSKEDLDGTLAIASAIKLEPQKALQMLAPIMRNLLKVVGVELPADLQKRVDEGTLDREAALEISTARAGNATTAARAKLEQEQREAADKASATKAQVDAVTKAGDTWFTEKAKADPDWSLKQDRVVELIELEIHRTQKYPANEKEARALFEGVSKKVDEELKKFKPAPKSHKPLDGSASPQSKALPKTSLEAAKMALAR